MSVSVGMDVSKATVDVAIGSKKFPSVKQYANSPAGHRAILKALPEGSQVVVEATGTYSVDLCLALHEAEGVEVMVANPRAVKDFRGAIRKRGKTDRQDALLLLEYAKRLDFTKWSPPSAAQYELRNITRRMRTVTDMCTAERNRLHAAKQRATPDVHLMKSIKRSIDFHTKEQARLLKRALKLIRGDAEMVRRFGLLTDIKGIGDKSGVQILGELGCLPTDMGAKQWTAHAGLDPVPWESGSSVNRKTRISKRGNRYLRAAMHMPALVAVRHQPQVRAFRNHLIENRGKTKLAAVVAVSRKLLVAIHGMWASDQHFDGLKFFPAYAAEEESGGSDRQPIRPAKAG